MISKTRVETRRRETLEFVQGIQKSGWLDRLVDERNALLELLRTEHSILKTITETQESLLNTLGELGDGPED